MPFLGLFKSRPFSLRSRAHLIGAVLALQALIIGLGWAATVRMAHTGMDERMTESLMEECERRARTFSSLLTAEVSAPIHYGDAGWDRAQTLVEKMQLPPGVSLYLLDEGGKVLCHEALRRSENVRKIDFSDLVVELSPRGDPATFASLNPLQPVAGQTDFVGGPAAVAILYNPTARVKVVVQCEVSGARAESRRLSHAMFVWGGIAGLCVLVMTLLGSAALVHRYDTALMRMNRHLEEEVERRMRQGLAIRNGLIFGLAKLADFRDTDTGRHLERIRAYCELLARTLQAHDQAIDHAWIERLKLASSLHDIGKVGIPDSILLKPDALTPEERKVMEMHVLLGADTLISVRRHAGDDDLINMAIQIALSHHERFDGRGYPYRLSGDQIPLPARIVALADMYDAITSDRVYRRAMSHREASALIVSQRGQHFDPVIVDAFIASQGDFARVHDKLHEATPDGRLIAEPETHLASMARRAAA